MKRDEFIKKLKDAAKEFGCKYVEKDDLSQQSEKNAVFRNNPDKDKGFIAFIGAEENFTGPYHDLSFVIFSSSDDISHCLISLAVGSLGFKNDYEHVSIPWLRRRFSRLAINNESSFLKNDFADIGSGNIDLVMAKSDYDQEECNFRSAVKHYAKFILASCIIDIKEEAGFATLKAWLAEYAKLSEWPSKAAHRDAIKQAQSQQLDTKKSGDQDDLAEVQNLLEERHFVVVQGAPGTGKTWLSNQIASKEIYESCFFTQFHAETTYSDFVCGIVPAIDGQNKEVKYEKKYGPLYSAIKDAREHPNKKVLLLIDEINRANLSNVLGEAFFLFEYGVAKYNYTVKVGDLEIRELPHNLYVLATMNTADKSLAVVDFALRRRFAWYTVYPHPLKSLDDPEKVFHKGQYQSMAEIFEKYATDEELSLQPGQAYFITDKKDEGTMWNRLNYELMPLIKEYLQQGYLARAKDDFVEFFRKQSPEIIMFR